MSILVLVVDDEPDVEALFRQQFRRDLRAQRFVMDFANSATDALGTRNLTFNSLGGRHTLAWGHIRVRSALVC